MRQDTDFLGNWKVARSIEDRFSNQVGRFVGVAQFSHAADDTLLYKETGEIQLEQGPTMNATRSYIWYFADNQIDVFFEDGRPFHSFIADGKVAGTDHPCGDDYYTVAYDFLEWPCWLAIWTVKGPRKDYTSSSTYLRE